MKEFIKKLFERRQFNTQERAAMQELYAFGEMFAHQIVRLTPECDFQLRAIAKLKDALADCETAMALNPKCDKQMGLPLGGCDAECGPNEFGKPASTMPEAELIKAKAAAQINEICAKANAQLQNMPGYARR